jgi:hypothetical protein
MKRTSEFLNLSYATIFKAMQEGRLFKDKQKGWFCRGPYPGHHRFTYQF